MSFDWKVADAPKPLKLKEHHLLFLDRLRESGATNMWGASEYLKAFYPRLKSDEAIKILGYWMNTFSDRMSRGETSLPKKRAAK